ncbi:MULTISPECIES: NAD kinase [unclassified Bacillus (in: firmicutes)]|uniref:NAD kinase n=1 Tax=unclassified Bacillus (in: firmicutes) TaxID=185979 RepID=UPI0006AE9D00|nr:MULTISPECIES: NAD kinase [unclassified Bacillus (in: firmicutes)]ALC84711.1 inorganic polyphosphate kinase [Bacillus sp. FJAT-22090]MDF2067887.1 NAD kinase [Bacillus sp. Cr_A10]
MTSRNTIFLYTKNDIESLEKKDVLADAIQSYGFQVVDNHQDASIIVSIGTDGSFLQAVRKTGFRQDCLYAGISTTGTLSMYCDFLIEDIEAMADAVLNDQIKVRKYPLMEISVNHNPKFYCLNEFAIRSNIIKTFVLDIIIDDKLFETFRGDGMVISTPTGSSAYNKSLNGAVVDPLLPCIQVTEIASVNSNEFRTLGTSFILSGNRSLELRLHKDWNDYPSMSTDNEALSIQHVETVSIALSNKIIKTVKLKDNSYWEKVKRSFL